MSFLIKGGGDGRPQTAFLARGSLKSNPFHENREPAWSHETQYTFMVVLDALAIEEARDLVTKPKQGPVEIPGRNLFTSDFQQ